VNLRFSSFPWTRGPLFEVSGSASVTICDRTREKMIADVFVETEEDLNNVYLILAAPDLYITCKKLIEYLRKHSTILDNFSPSEIAILDEMATAVAKAEGEYQLQWLRPRGNMAP